MTPKSARARTGQRLLAAFREAGAVEVAPDVLLPAETLLELYGEDIRARAYVTDDPIRGEVMLRPDFTVPVVQMHMAGGAEPARYCYLGEVFRKQDHGDTRPEKPRDNEYLQVGYEAFSRDTARADAEVFALFHRLLAPFGLTATLGDMALIDAAIAALPLSEPRRAALAHHIWRPGRFDRLLVRFSLPGTTRNLAPAGKTPWTGLRTQAEMAARIARMDDDAGQPPLSPAAVDRLHALLAVACPADRAVAELQALGQPALAPAIDRLAERLAHLARAGIAPGSLRFDASHGRGTMEYYDGMTFTFIAPARPDWPPVASGGRYDRLTAELGRGAAIPAVGGIIRPGLVAEMEGAC
ncbi:ATP phosphoribosyltransferase regulatory subunit [Paracoccus suum]|uniref:ATP phosphoribosyltransferase regulatory subunit n=1 Tax=Paracoccus suum TaxID=2259340 RepID=UPI001F544CE8|nr:ATP phosphoribosyltransferase regulatory subunit [Paracoccus suum]